MKKLAASFVTLVATILTSATIALVMDVGSGNGYILPLMEDGQHTHLYLEATDRALMTAIGRVTPTLAQNPSITPSNSPQVPSFPTVESLTVTPIIPAPNIVSATNISGGIRNIRETCTTAAALKGTVGVNQTIQVYADSMHFNDNYIWFQMVGTFYCVAFEQINPVQVYIRMNR